MPAAATRKPRKTRQAKPATTASQQRQILEAVFLSSALPFAVTGSTVGESKVPAAILAQFGGPRYSPAEQSADFSSQATRILKDILSVGRWKVGVNPESGEPLMLDVTPDLLNQIVENFRLAKSRGVDFNLGKGHGDPRTGLIHADDLLAPIDDIATDGNQLWSSSYVSPEQAVYLSNKARKVSVGLRWNWMDGLGNVYPVQLVHIAVTDNPIVAGQGPFVRLANDPLGTVVNPGDGTAATPTTSQDASQISDASIPAEGSFEQHLDLWNRALGLLGLPSLPDSVDDSTLPLAVDILLSTIEPGEGEEENDGKLGEGTDESATSGAGVQTLPSLTPAVGANMPAELANTFRVLFGDEVNMSTATNPAAPAAPVAGAPAGTAATPAAPAKPADAAVNLANMISGMADQISKQGETIVALTGQLTNLSNIVTQFQTEKAGAAETAYKAKLANLASEMKITADEVTMFTNIGPSIKWDLANLSALDGRPSFASGNRFAKPAASGAAPAVSGVVPAMSNEDILQGVNMLLSPLGKKLKELPAA